MSSNIPHGPVGNVVNIGIPDSQDIPRLVFTAPYFEQSPLAELIEPSVIEAVNNVLPSLVPPYVDNAAQAAVQAQAVLLVGSTMSGPLFLNPVMPTADAQAASKAYVDTMLSTAGVPEVPPVPVGQVWARETGQWTPISQTGGTFLPITGGAMQGNISMSGNTVTNMAAVPAMPNGAAPAQWVLNQIASVSLYQGTWNADTNVPDLTQLSTHVNAYTWIALTTSPSGVVVGAAIPGLQGTTVFNGDTIIYSTVEGGFKAIHGGGITLPEADGRYVQLAGSQMSGALLLNANATQPLQAVTFQQLESGLAGVVTPDAPADGQAYLRVGVGTNRWVPGLPLAGGILTGALTLSGNATQPLNAVPLQQVQSLITAGTTGFLPLAGGQMTGLLSLSGNATANLNAVPLQQLNAMLQTYAPIQNPSFTGTVTLPGNAASALQAVPLQQVQSLITAGTAGYLPLTGGTLTGALTLPAGSQSSGSLLFTGVGVAAWAFSASPGPAIGIAGNGFAYGLGALSSNNTSPPAPFAFGFDTTTASTASYAVGVNGVMTGWAVRTNMTTGTVAPILQLVSNWNITAASATISGTSSATWPITISDRRMKENIVAATSGLGIIEKLNVYSCDILSPQPGLATTHWDCALIADEVETTIPPAFIPAMGDNGYQNLSPLPIVCTLVKGMQQLLVRVQALEANANITPAAAETA